MNNILVITPIYKIIGRKDIETDTQCVHDLIKYWGDYNKIKVVIPHIRGMKQLHNFFNKELLQYYKNGYNYNLDNIDILMVESQNIYFGQFKRFKKDIKRMCGIIERNFAFSKFEPSFITVHIPSVCQEIIEQLNYSTRKKIAVLHYSDVKYAKKQKQNFITYLENNYDSVYCRSNAIYNYFKTLNLKNLESEIVYSGVPKVNTKFEINKSAETKRKKILYVGKLIKRKNLDLLIKALSKIDKNCWELNIIGKGKMFDKYQKIVNKNGLEQQVKFLGTLPKEDVLKYMKKSDIFCMPSVGETLGLVYIEAMSQGCITIGTKNEGIDGIIKNEINGYLTNPNEEDIYKLLYKIINSKSIDNISMSKNAIKTAKFYNEEDMSKIYYKLLTK